MAITSTHTLEACSKEIGLIELAWCIWSTCYRTTQSHPLRTEEWGSFLVGNFGWSKQESNHWLRSGKSQCLDQTKWHSHTFWNTWCRKGICGDQSPRLSLYSQNYNSCRLSRKFLAAPNRPRFLRSWGSGTEAITKLWRWRKSETSPN